MARMLIVDDDRRYLHFTKTVFEINGMDVYTAESAAEALQLVKEMEFDMMITDYTMPLMNGVDLAIMVKNKIPDLPIVLLTGLATAKLSLLAKGAGIDNVLDKCMSPDELVRIVKEESIKSKKNDCTFIHDVISPQPHPHLNPLPFLDPLHT